MIKIDYVKKTKIFVSTNKTLKRQITIYSNVVCNESDNNSLILLVPYPESIKFYNLDKYTNLFNQYNNIFEDINICL